MSKKVKPVKLSDCIWQKRVPNQYSNKFIDIYDLVCQNKDINMVFSTGNLDPNKLTKSDHKKHGAIYISLNELPEFFYKKKFATNKKLKKHFEDCQDFANKYISKYMQNNTTISVEIMGIQNNSFNVLKNNSVLIPHGLIIAKFPNKLESKEKLDEFCEESICEGYVILDKTNNMRLKLKREYFDSTSLLGKQRGIHNKSIKESYDESAVSMMTEDWQEEKVITNLVKANLIVLPLKDVIEKQMKFPFDGDKMMNLFETIGSKDTYRYTDKTLVPNIFEKDLEYQLKFDGETGLLHKDTTGKIHLLIKFVIDVYEIEKELNKSFIYRFGYL